MANNLMLNVNPEFNLEAFVMMLTNNYRTKGYNVSYMNLNGVYVVTFEKNTGGINTVLGLGEGISATCMCSNGVLSVAFSNEEWTTKIIGAVIGWALCLIPLITAIIGTTRQLQLPKNISTDATVIAMSMQ